MKYDFPSFAQQQGMTIAHTVMCFGGRVAVEAVLSEGKADITARGGSRGAERR